MLPVRERHETSRVLSKKSSATLSRARMRCVKRCCDGCVISPAYGSALRWHRLFAPFDRRVAVEFFAL
jgi:hypothetical protein